MLEAQGFAQRLPFGGHAPGAPLLMLAERVRRGLGRGDQVMPGLNRLRAESQQIANSFVAEGGVVAIAPSHARRGDPSSIAAHG